MAFILDPSAPPPAVGAAGGNGDLVKDSSTATFMADVIEASMEVPVIVDFWAPWCGPCKTLGPALEKAVRLAGGLVRLVKINVDENQDLAAQMNVRSVPSVFGFRQGRPVDGFAGAVPESQIKSFIERLTGGAKPPLEEALDMAREALDAGDAASASQVFAEILAHDPAHPGAVAGMIRCLVATGDLKEARQAVSRLPDALAANGEVAAAISALDLAEQASGAGDVGAFKGRLDANPDDHQARLDLAMALYAEGRAEAAIEELLELIRRDRAWNEEAGRKQLVKLFDALGPAHPLTAAGRRRLSSILFS
ncbi:MAG: co-chaperone YbbN [Rhodospirillales bacterium]|nr:co-chaperone YbbN [Rhodospirillales bacterium]